MVAANVVSDFQIGNTRIKIADDYCKKTASDAERTLRRIAVQAQRQFIAAAAAGKYEQDAEIPAGRSGPCGSGDPCGGSGHGDRTRSGQAGPLDLRERVGRGH